MEKNIILNNDATKKKYIRKYYIVYKHPENYGDQYGCMEPCYIAESLEEAEKQIADTGDAVIHIVNEHLKDVEEAIPYVDGKIDLRFYLRNK